MKFCTHCKRNVKPVKTPFSWGWLFVWWFMCTIPYIVYHGLMKRKNRCPICGLKGLTKAQKLTIEA
jgi:hypothetical protein